MDSYHIILGLVAFLLLALVVTIVFLMYYVGYFHQVLVAVGPSVVSELQVAYKFHQGNYQNCGPFFQEITKLCPKLRGIAVYYDDPEKVDPNSCRYIVGIVIAEGKKEKPDPVVVDLLEANGFSFIDFPKVDFSVKTSHPYTLFISGYIAGNKAFPLLQKYIQDEKLSAHPFIEFYEEDTIHYMVPLSKQSEFYVDEYNDT